MLRADNNGEVATMYEKLLKRAAVASLSNDFGQETMFGNFGSVEQLMAFNLGRSSFALDSLGRSVTCCVAFGGDHSYLSEALQSLQFQTVNPNSVLVGIDGSCSPIAIPATWRVPVEITYFPRKRGPFAVMSDLLSQVKSEYVMIADSDDLSHPCRLELLLHAMLTKEADLVGSAFAEICEDQHNISSIGTFPHEPKRALRRQLCHFMLYPTILIRTDLYRRCGGFSNFESFGIDTEFLIRAVSSGDSVNVHFPLYMKRRRAESLTASAETGMGSYRRQAVLDFTICTYQSLFHNRSEETQIGQSKSESALLPINIK